MIRITALPRRCLRSRSAAVLAELPDAEGEGADPNARNSSGDTPLHNWAFNRAPIESGRLLIEGGAEVDARDDYNLTPLHSGTFSPRSWGANVRLLIAAGADPNARSADTLTPLHMAALVWNRAYC